MEFNWYFWKTVIPLGIGTLLIRSSLIFLGQKIKLSNFSKDLFTYIPAAVLPALALPMVYMHEGIVAQFAHKERLIAFIIALIVSLKIRNILVIISVGLLSLYILKLIY